MTDPFKINEPTCISFSGGRTSGYMLWRVLQSNHGLPPEAVVCFANTGKEEEATLNFVRDCAEHWQIPINWLEYRNEGEGFAVVDHKSASRDGEPFEALIRKRQYLPNPVTRFCTSELKIRTMHKWLRASWAGLGWESSDLRWNQMIGIRADEQRRVAKIQTRGHSTETTKETMLMPLAVANVGVHEVNDFWAQQRFTLQLSTVKGRTLAGNCDLCFLKPANQVLSLIKEKPERAAFWVRMESLGVSSKPSGAFFRNDRPSYGRMLDFAQRQSEMFDPNEEGIPCFCGD